MDQWKRPLEKYAIKIDQQKHQSLSGIKKIQWEWNAKSPKGTCEEDGVLVAGGHSGDHVRAPGGGPAPHRLGNRGQDTHLQPSDTFELRWEFAMD